MGWRDITQVHRLTGDLKHNPAARVHPAAVTPEDAVAVLNAAHGLADPDGAAFGARLATLMTSVGHGLGLKDAAVRDLELAARFGRLAHIPLRDGGPLEVDGPETAAVSAAMMRWIGLPEGAASPLDEHAESPLRPILTTARESLEADPQIGANEVIHKIQRDRPGPFTSADDSDFDPERLTVDRVADVLGQLFARKNADTALHMRRVADLSELIARRLGVAPEERAVLYMAARLHDVGKLGAPDTILNKTDALTPGETARMRHHVENGAAILAVVPGMVRASRIVLQHHEKLDGSGYPHGLTGSEIDPLTLILVVADVFDALTDIRPYKPAMSAAATLELMARDMAEELDPATLAALQDIKL